MTGAKIEHLSLQWLCAAEDDRLHPRQHCQPIRIAQNTMSECRRVAFRVTPKGVYAGMCVRIKGFPRVVLEPSKRFVCFLRSRLLERLHHVLSLRNVLGRLLRI